MNSIRTTPTPAEVELVRLNPHLAFGWMLVTASKPSERAMAVFPLALSQPIQLHDGSWARNLVATADEMNLFLPAYATSRENLKAQYLLRDGANAVPAYSTKESSDHLPMSHTTVPCQHFHNV
jgi:hypothetical protein